MAVLPARLVVRVPCLFATNDRIVVVRFCLDSSS